MALFAIAVPIAPGKAEQFKAFIDALNGPRKAEFAASRKKLGVRERTFHQHTPMGDLVVVTLEGDDPAGAFTRFAAADDAFTRWFAAQVKEVHGVDLSTPPSGPLPTLITDTGA